MKILIAEDDMTSRTILEGTLPKWGYEVVSTPDGVRAWEVLQKPEAPQLALLDWMMPGMNGLTLCRKLREQEREAPLYVIMLTAKSDPGDIALGLEAGADDYVAKPYHMTELRARVDVGRRTIELQHQVQHYALEMEHLARQRAVQLAHSDRMATLGILSAGVAHEINNPMSFIAINTQTLESNWEAIRTSLAGQGTADQVQRAQLLAAEVPAIFADIKSGVERIRAIVDGLRTYSRSEGTRQPDVCLGGCVGAALKLCANRLKYNITLDNTVPADLPHVKANPRELEQVFINLFINAADVMEEDNGGRGTLTISATGEKDRVEIRVRDTGPGISEDNLGMVFAPFYTTKGVGKGTGLGLSISRNIIEDHNGTLTVRNHPAGGAEFCVSLPAALVADEKR